VAAGVGEVAAQRAGGVVVLREQAERRAGLHRLVMAPAALEMPPAEQEDRMRSMRAPVGDFSVYRRAGRMLLDATRLRRSDRLASRLAGNGTAETRP